MRAAPTPMPTPISSATLLLPPRPPELEAELVVAMVGAEIVGFAMKGNFDEEDDLVDKGMSLRRIAPGTSRLMDR